jgi:hypothetical protein
LPYLLLECSCFFILKSWLPLAWQRFLWLPQRSDLQPTLSASAFLSLQPSWLSFPFPVQGNAVRIQCGAPQASDEKLHWEHGTEANSRFYTVSSHAAKDAGFTVGYQEGKHDYFPYPQTVKNMNPNLEQNPGW